MFSTTNLAKGTEAAKACFQENLRLFGNAQTQPEKFNLYSGLQHLAIAVEQVNTRLDKIESQLKRVG